MVDAAGCVATAAVAAAGCDRWTSSKRQRVTPIIPAQARINKSVRMIRFIANYPIKAAATSTHPSPAYPNPAINDQLFSNLLADLSE